MTDNLATVSLQGASIVSQLQSRNVGDYAIRSHRWQSSCEPCIMSLFSPSANNIISVLDFINQTRDTGRIFWKISIHGNDDLPFRMMKPRREGSCLSVVDAEPD